MAKGGDTQQRAATTRDSARGNLVTRNFLPLAVSICLAAGIHLFFGLTDHPFAAKLCLDIAIAIILAVSLNMVNGYTGQFSMGHAGFMAIGGYFAAALTYYGSIRLFGSAQPVGGMLSWGFNISDMPDGTPLVSRGDLLFLAACLLGGLVAAFAGYLVGLPSLRLRGDYLAIVTLGFGEIVRVLLQTSRPQLSRAADVEAAPIYQLPLHLGQALGFNRVPAYTTLFWTYIVVCITVLVAFRLKYSTAGRAMLAIREDEIAAEAMGINTTRYKVRAFVLASFFAGVAGALFAHQIGSINAGELGFIKSFDIIIIIVLGGLGSISGAVIAAVVLTLLPEALREVAEYRMIAYAVMLILIMILRPQGLFGIREVWELGPVRRLWRRVRRQSSGGAGA